MAWNRRTSRGLIVASALVVVAAGIAVSKDRSKDAPASARPSGSPASEVVEKVTSRAPRLSIGKDSASLIVAPGSYVSRLDSDTMTYRKPEVFDGRTLTVRASDDTIGHVIVYAIDVDRIVEDVMVLGNSGSEWRPTSFEWVMSKDGVELAWDAEGFSDWTVERNGESLTTRAAGHHIDPTPPDDSNRYDVEHVEEVEFEHDGKTVTADKPISYLISLPGYDDSLIGQPIDLIGALESPGIRRRPPAPQATRPTSRPSPEPPTPTATAAPPRARPRFATIHADRYDGCTAILAVNTTPVSEATADADNRYFGEQLMGDGSSGNVRSVGLSSCGDIPVVVAGMKISTARLPAYGPGGTPVLAYRQRPVVAF